ncbi:flagellar biosynthesis anti-sigma factor FlgM [Desulfofustis glycolicus]|uniref:Negative regulator of flagellin synthesis n=1 Tax=Desulfofustis glycolicus DSM 9705 TaxID=1121409 RepID=A0A1M5U0E4_9BACT|nr:flagellar biosynthesis anti-sigma factor FlgM [Desulfofustis glycolicus]SHH56428.1 anti-sigma-28 factor, FlgM family [Desulfofustis glycolicus DSM 9705]
MMIDFFGVGGPPNIGGPKKVVKPQGGAAGETKKSDQVEFSSVLQHVNKAQSGSSGAEIERAARVQQLKEQVANGTYEPDIHKVAASLLQYLVETNQKV